MSMQARLAGKVARLSVDFMGCVVRDTYRLDSYETAVPAQSTTHEN
jgi:hypothetical protein